MTRDVRFQKTHTEGNTRRCAPAILRTTARWQGPPERYWYLQIYVAYASSVASVSVGVMHILVDGIDLSVYVVSASRRVGIIGFDIFAASPGRRDRDTSSAGSSEV